MPPCRGFHFYLLCVSVRSWITLPSLPLFYLSRFVLAAPDADLGNFEAQFKATFDKIKITLAKAGATVDDIVSMSVFMTDLRLVPQFNKFSKELFKKGYPAVTFVEVGHRQGLRA